MTNAYYDVLAPYYKYIYEDWDSSTVHQAKIIDSVIKEFFGADVREILDVACGIGTQSIGLAQIGYNIKASDISPIEIEHARVEAAKRDLVIEFDVGDMRDISSRYQQKFDLIIAFDNAIPHLLSESEILLTLKQFYDGTTPDGGCMISVRDYANMDLGGTKFYPRKVHIINGTTTIIFDLWQFDGAYYDITTYIVEDNLESPVKTVISRGGRYYCVTIATLEKLFQQAGFNRVEILRDKYFQPLLVGIKS